MFQPELVHIEIGYTFFLQPGQDLTKVTDAFRAFLHTQPCGDFSIGTSFVPDMPDDGKVKVGDVVWYLGFGNRWVLARIKALNVRAMGAAVDDPGNPAVQAWPWGDVDRLAVDVEFIFPAKHGLFWGRGQQIKPLDDRGRKLLADVPTADAAA